MMTPNPEKKELTRKEVDEKATLSKDRMALFLTYYQHFQDKMSRGLGTRSIEDVIVHFLFGVSGAGKSTYLSRLAEQKETKEEFFADLRAESSVKTRMRAGVEIGGVDGKSTTVSPNLIEIKCDAPTGSRFIMDMPGFADSSNERRVIVDVLQKCALTRNFKGARFLVVMGMDVLLGSGLAVLAQLYCEPFEEIFGAEFNKYVEQIFFILTKNDLSKTSTESFQKAVTTKIIACAEEGYHNLSKFLARMLRAFLIVDYENDDSGTFISKLDDLIENALKSDDRSGVTLRALSKIHSLDVSENDLSAEAKETIERCIQKVEKSREEYEMENKKLKKAMEEAVSTCEKYREQFEGHLRALAEVDEKIDTADRSLASYGKRKAELLRIQETSTYECKLASDALAQLEGIISTVEPTIHVSLRPTAVKPMFGAHIFRTCVTFGSVVATASNVQVVVVPAASAQIHELVQEVKQFGMNPIMRFHPENLLYNSAKNFTAEHLKGSAMTTEIPTYALDFSSPTDFEVHLFYQIAAAETSVGFRITEAMVRKRDETSTAAASALDELEKLDDDNRAWIVSLRESRVQRAELLSLLATLYTTVLEFDAEVKALDTEARELRMRHVEVAATHDADPGVVHGAKLLQIFKENNLSTDLEHEIRRHSLATKHYRHAAKDGQKAIEESRMDLDRTNTHLQTRNAELKSRGLGF